ncbi:nitroreductase family protein [Prevotella falsenii]
MEQNPVLKTIMERRSIRKYMDKPVEHEKLEILAMAGINAPSSHNGQQWQVRVIEDKKLMAEYKSMFYDAPNVICICTPKENSEYNAGLLSENIMIAAQSMGLGTVCLAASVRLINSDAQYKSFLDRLEISEDYKLSYVIAVGYPAEQPQAKPRDVSKVKFIK